MPSEESDSTKTEIVWTNLHVPGGGSADGRSFLSVSNPSVPLPGGVQTIPEFVSEQESHEILNSIDARKYVWEGFDQRRRLQRYILSPSSTNGLCELDENDDGMYPLEEAPSALVQLRDRLHEATGLSPTHAALELHPFHKHWSSRRRSDYASNHTVTTFESPTICADDDCRCLVAQIPIERTVIQHWNRPAERKPNHWTLASPDHWTYVRIKRGTALVRTRECLNYWRSRIVAVQEGQDCGGPLTEDSSVLILKLYTLPTRGPSSRDTEPIEHDDGFGYVPSSADRRPEGPTPALPDLLTVIITTSPIKSNPSTEVLQRAMQTFSLAGTEFVKCRKVIVCGE